MTITELMEELKNSIVSFEITPSIRWYSKNDIEEKMERMKKRIEFDITGLSDEEREVTKKFLDEMIGMIKSAYTAGYEKGDSDRLEYEM